MVYYHDPDTRKQHLHEAAHMVGLPLDEVVLPTDRRIQVNGLGFHLLDWGTEGKPPVLFVHGNSLTAHTWDLVCLALRPRYHCLALDLRGHGDSDWSPNGEYSLEAYRSDLEAIVDALRIERFILVGMSLGGATSLAYAGGHANRLAGLVLVDVGPEGRPAGQQRITSFVSQDSELDSLEAFVARAVAFNPLRQPEMLRRSLLHNLRHLPTGKWTWKWDPNLRKPQTEQARARRRETLWAAVPHTTCPTLVVRGGNSDIFHDEDAEKLAAALPDGSWVRIEGAGHTVQGDQPKALAETLRAFFDRVVG